MGQWNRSSGASKVTPKKKLSAVRGIVAGALIVVALGALCVWMFSGGENAPKAKVEKEYGRIKEVTPAAAPKVKEESPADEEVVKPTKKREGTPEWVIKEFNRKKVHTVITNNSAIAHKSAHRNSTEHLMLMIFGTELGSMPPPLPSLSKKSRDNLVSTLLDKNEVAEGDSQETREDKEIIAAAKKELTKYIKEGGDVDSFFSHYHNELETAYRLRRDGMKAVLDVQRGENPELAQEMLDAVNTKLKERGIKRVKLPGLTTKED